MARIWFVAFAIAMAAAGQVYAAGNYTATAGKVAFTVGSNIPFVKVAGSTVAVTGGGEGSVNGDVATVRRLRFEIDPTTFKTGLELRDRHLYEKVFTTPSGSIPKLVLSADNFLAKLNPRTARWEGDLQAQLSIRGVTRPVTFHASGAKKGRSAVLTAVGVVKISDFGVKPISNAGVAINNEVKITVAELVLTPDN